MTLCVRALMIRTARSPGWILKDSLFNKQRILSIFIFSRSLPSTCWRYHTLQSNIPCLRSRCPLSCRLMPTSRSLRPRRNCGCLDSAHDSDSVIAAAPAAGFLFLLPTPAPADTPCVPPIVELRGDDASPFTFFNPGGEENLTSDKLWSERGKQAKVHASFSAHLNECTPKTRASR